MVSFLTSDGKFPPFAQRRLDWLLAKNREETLEASEARELREMLAYIDQKSIELLADLEKTKRASRINKKRPRRRTTSA